MELDDLKKAWNAQQPPPQTNDRELIQQIIHRSHRGLSKMLRWELGFGIFAIVALIVAIVFNSARMAPFMIKLIVPLVAYAIPVYYRLYHSARLLQSIDLSGDIRSTLTQFLRYYSRTLRVYQWGGYGAVLVSMVLIFTDQTMQHLNWTWKGIVLVYMIIAMLLIGPFVKYFYGSRARAIREYLEGDL